MTTLADAPTAEVPPPAITETARTRWMDTIFPEAPAVNLRPLTLAGYALGFLAALAYLSVSPLGRVHYTRIWAEDGQLFLADGAGPGFPGILLHPYAGYLHVLPRLAGEVVSHLPVTWWAVGIAVAAAALRAAMAVTVYAATVGHARTPVRLLLAAALVVLPAGNVEAINNVANLHWFMAVAAFWLLLYRPPTRLGNATGAVALLVLVLSSPLALLLVPLALARLAFGRGRGRWAGVAVLGGAAMQTVAIATQGRHHDPVEVWQAVAAAEARGPLVTMAGPELAIRLDSWALHLTSVMYSWPGLVATIVVVVIATRGLVRGDAARRAITALCLGYAAAILALDLFMNWRDGWLRIDQVGYVTLGQREGLTACYLLFAALVFGLDRYATGRPGTWRRVGVAATRVALAGLLVAGVVVQWRSDMLRDWVSSGPSWSEALNNARQECDSGARSVRVPVAPAQWGAAQIACDRLHSR
jgi:hypothetical protein